jgi:hypothetical protein
MEPFVKVDASDVLEVIFEMTDLARTVGVPAHLQKRLGRVEDGGIVLVAGEPSRYVASPELLCILATLRALKGDV